jgi:predicted N-formylglutamate amidohydrolase
MPAISEFTAIPGNAALTAADRAARIGEIFRPYHDRISALLDARTAAGKRTVLVAMHSFTPVFKGEPRAIEVGILYWRRTKLAEIMLDLLRGEADLTVGENAPYALTENSDYSIPFHAERRGLEHVEIEIRQDLIATPEGQLAWAGRFARLLTHALPRLG